MRDKKAQVNSIAPAIMALVFAGIILVLGMVIMQETRDTQIGVISDDVANETLAAWQGTTNQTLAKSNVCGLGAIDVASVVVYNETKGGSSDTQIVLAGNYTVRADGQMINDTSDISDTTTTGGIWQISYDYTWGGESCVAGNNTLVGLGTFADFWEIIVLAIVISVVIGLLLVIFGGAGRKR